MLILGLMRSGLHLSSDLEPSLPSPTVLHEMLAFSHFFSPSWCRSCCSLGWECTSVLLLEWVGPFLLFWTQLKTYFPNEALTDHPVSICYPVTLLSYNLSNIFSVMFIIIWYLPCLFIACVLLLGCKFHENRILFFLFCNTSSLVLRIVFGMF